VPRLHATET